MYIVCNAESDTLYKFPLNLAILRFFANCSTDTVVHWLDQL